MSDAVLAARSSNVKLVFFIKKGFYSRASKYSYAAYNAANVASIYLILIYVQILYDTSLLICFLYNSYKSCE